MRPIGACSFAAATVSVNHRRTVSSDEGWTAMRIGAGAAVRPRDCAFRESMARWRIPCAIILRALVVSDDETDAGLFCERV